MLLLYRLLELKQPSQPLKIQGIKSIKQKMLKKLQGQNGHSTYLKLILNLSLDNKFFIGISKVLIQGT